jgi:hypothetical protein
MEALVSGGRSLLEPSARNQAGKGIGIMGEVFLLVMALELNVLCLTVNKKAKREDFKQRDETY